MLKRSIIFGFFVAICMCLPAHASDANKYFYKLTITMPVPDDITIPTGESFYYGYKGQYSDVMAELNKENNYTYTADVPVGDYELYQIHDASGFDYRTVITDKFTLSANKTIYVYIQEKSGNYLNQSLIPESASLETLSAYGTADNPPEDDGYTMPTITDKEEPKPEDEKEFISRLVKTTVLILIGAAFVAIVACAIVNRNSNRKES